jgi:CheY-like chemotaxis protein
VPWNLLIVEDDADVAEQLRQVFETRGFHVWSAGNGQEAIDIVHEHGFRPSAVLLDLLMPVMDGVEFLRARRADALFDSVPVIVMTAQPQMLHGVPEPVFTRLTKPIHLAKLLDAVHRACHGQPAA